MAGNKKWNSDLDLLGKMKISTVPNNTGTVLTYNNSTKEISTRTNSQIIDDLGLITATNIASSYYTKTQLQTSGQAEVNWGNITEKPTTFTPSVHNHDDRYHLKSESVPYTGADKTVDLNTQQLTLNGTFEKKSNVFELSHLGNDAYTSSHFKRLTDVASLTLSSSATIGDIIITIPIRTSTRWMMEVDIFSNITLAEKLIISAYSTGNGAAQVSCLTDTEVISEVKFCRDSNNNIVLILKRTTGTSSFTYGKVNINDFYHWVSYHADLAVKSNYKVEFIDESTLTGITVNSIIQVDKVNFGTKNIDFTSGAISKTQNNVRHFRDVYQFTTGLGGSAINDRILSISFPPQNGLPTMFRVEIDFGTHTQSTYTGKLTLTFYKQTNSLINASINALWTGRNELPTNIIKIGFNSLGNISINIGDSTTDWIPYTSIRVSSIESKMSGTGWAADHSKGWTHEFISDETGYTGLVTAPLTISANQDWVNTQITNAGHSHSNKANLDTINQNLGTGYSPTFNNITVGYTTSGYRGFSSNLPYAFLNAGTFQSIYTGGVLASGNYADNTKIPTNGIYSKGNIVTGGTIEIKNDQGTTSAAPLTLVRSSQVGLSFKIAGVDNFLGVDAGGVLRYGLNASHMTNYTIWHSGNFNPSSYVTQTSLNTQLSSYATLAGTQTFTGTNTFDLSPVVPTPTLDTHAVNRKYVTDNYYTKTEVDAIVNSDVHKEIIAGNTIITHNLNTYDIDAAFYDVNTLYTVGARVKRLTTNTIQVDFDSTPINPIKAMIKKY